MRPKNYEVSCTGGSTYTDNVVDIGSDFGASTRYCAITNTGSNLVTVKINGYSDGLLRLDGAGTWIFEHDDLRITKLEFDNSVSGATTAHCRVFCSVG